jgi:hypothetical protein
MVIPHNQGKRDEKQVNHSSAQQAKLALREQPNPVGARMSVRLVWASDSLFSTKLAAV